jgi:molecular chaperone GrpE
MENGTNASNNTNQAADTNSINLDAIDLETLKKLFMDEKDKSEKYFANWQRAEADFSNYKKRSEQEKTDLVNFSNSTLIFNLLPVLDDFDRAFSAAPENLPWTDGIKLINSKLQALLKATGLIEIEALNQPFDPNLHEAVAHIEGNEGKVLSIVQKGYKLKDKMLRPALVVVGNGKTN